jgi:hypothetical protein
MITPQSGQGFLSGLAEAATATENCSGLRACDSSTVLIETAEN